MRPLAAADLPRLVELEAACFPEGPWSARALDGCWAGPAVGVERGGALVGYAIGRLVVDEVELLRTGVHPDHRRAGLGVALTVAFLDACLARGATAAQLEVRVGNAAAIAVYARAGFATVGRRPRYYADGEDALLMTSALPLAGPR